MNRRTFLTGVIASTATGLPLTSMAATLDEPRWDPVSQLYGNMFDTLGKAEDGKMQFVSKTAEIGTAVVPSIFGVLHNNADTAQAMLGLADSDVIIDFSQIDSVQTYIEPGGYGLIQLSYLPEEFNQQTLDKLTPGTSSKDEAEKLPYADLFASLPLEIKNVSFNSGTMRVEIENKTDHDFGALSVGGLVIWFDESGQQTDGMTFVVTGALKASSSLTVKETYYQDDSIVTDRFLIGVKGYTS